MWQLCHGASENIDNAQDEIHGLYLQQPMEECAQEISFVMLHKTSKCMIYKVSVYIHNNNFMHFISCSIMRVTNKLYIPVCFPVEGCPETPRHVHEFLTFIR